MPQATPQKTPVTAGREFNAQVARIARRATRENDDARGAVLQTARGIMALMDGFGTTFPRCELRASPHEDDEAFHKKNGENYFDPDVVAAGGYRARFERLLAGDKPQMMPEDGISRPVSAESLRDGFVWHVLGMVDYWSDHARDLTGTPADGLAFSTFAALDGCNVTLPMFLITLRPLPGAPMPDGYTDGLALDVALHETYHDVMRKVHAEPKLWQEAHDDMVLNEQGVLDKIGMDRSHGMMDEGFYTGLSDLLDPLVKRIGLEGEGDMDPAAAGLLYGIIERAAIMTGPQVTITMGDDAPAPPPEKPAPDRKIVFAAIQALGLTMIKDEPDVVADKMIAAKAHSDALIADIEAFVGGSKMQDLPRTVLEIAVLMASDTRVPEIRNDLDDTPGLGG